MPTSEIISQETATSIREKADSKSSMHAIAFETWNEEFQKVRTLDINGELWFVGKDVCTLFGDKNHKRSLGRIDNEDKKKVELIDSMNRKQTATVINESGLYSLLFAMQPQKAHNDGIPDEYPIEIRQRIEKIRKFKRFVTAEVLPSIRKHGAYFTSEVLYNSMRDPRELAKLLDTLADEQGMKEAKVKTDNEIIDVSKNKKRLDKSKRI